jgi:hypothetical protein
MEQLAGDEIAPRKPMRIASGLQRMGPLRKNAGNQEVASFRNEVLAEDDQRRRRRLPRRHPRLRPLPRS